MFKDEVVQTSTNHKLDAKVIDQKFLPIFFQKISKRPYRLYLAAFMLIISL